MKKILLVEDDHTLAAALEGYLASHSLQVETCATLGAADAALARTPDAIVLDWRLPDGDGVDWLRSLRVAEPMLPVILLTARNELADKVMALELGANDYVTKPFEPRELLARIRVQLRETMPTPARLASSGIVLDETTREVTFRGELLTLTRTEFNLLQYFLERPRCVLARHEILDHVWGVKYPTTRTVDVHVMQLRQKLEPELFETVHGVGYRFQPCEKRTDQ